MEGTNNLEIFNSIVNALNGLDNEAKKRTLQSVITFLNLDINFASSYSNLIEGPKKQNDVSFSQNRDMSAKEFLREKLPQTDVERIACLAYYLTHYRGMQFFKTLDLSALNTEAAQPKFSNAAVAVSNAIRAGLVVQGSKGSNQLSAAGEVFVQALPDREAARLSVKNMRVRKRNKKSSSKNEE